MMIVMLQPSFHLSSSDEMSLFVGFTLVRVKIEDAIYMNIYTTIFFMFLLVNLKYPYLIQIKGLNVPIVPIVFKKFKKITTADCS